MILLQIQSLRLLVRVRKPDPHRLRPHSFKSSHHPAPIRLRPHDLMRPRRVGRHGIGPIILIRPNFGEIGAIGPSVTLHEPGERSMDVVAIAMRVGPIAPIHFGLNVRSRIDLDDKIDGHCFVIDEQIDAEHVVRGHWIVRSGDDSRAHAGRRVVRVAHIDQPLRNKQWNGIT